MLLISKEIERSGIMIFIYTVKLHV
jgi:hypothetical protein